MTILLQCVAFAGGLMSILVGLTLVSEGYSSRFNLITSPKKCWLGAAVIFAGLMLIRGSFL